MKLHDFLVERAMFPFPQLTEDRTADTTDVSKFEVGMLERVWKAGHAVRDDTLVQKLCDALEGILEDTPLMAVDEIDLLTSFSPRLEFDRYGNKRRGWNTNPSEAQVSIKAKSRSSFGLTLAQSRALLDRGFLEATGDFLRLCGPYNFQDDREKSVEGGSSKVDYEALVNDIKRVLLEAKSPSVMKIAGELLPSRGIELKWVCGQSLVPKLLSKVSALFYVHYNICFTAIYAGRIVPGLEKIGMVVFFLPQLLDRVPACEG